MSEWPHTSPTSAWRARLSKVYVPMASTAWTAKDVCPGDVDQRVLALAAAAGRIVVTHDWGFGELTVRRAQSASGVIILSLYALPAGTRETHAVTQIVSLGDAAGGHLAVVEPGRVRVRPLRDKQ